MAFWRPLILPLCLAVSGTLQAQTGNRSEVKEHYQRAQAALQAKQPGVAEQEFRAILQLDPYNASAYANLGVIAYGERQYADASADFKAALKIKPSLANAKAMLGMSLLRQGHGAEAEPLLEESFRETQDDKLKAEVGMDLIGFYYQSQDLDRCVDILRAIQHAKPDSPDSLYTAYRVYSDLAARSLSVLAEAAPDSVEMHQVLAQALAAQGDFSGAIGQYRKALEIDPSAPEIHYEIGQMILSNSQTEPARAEAEKEFKLSLAGDPNSSYSEYMLGEIAWLRSNPEEALADDLRAIALQPGLADAHIAAGKALTALGRPAEALDHLQQAVRLDPRNEVAHYRLAQAYRKLGRTPDADREQQAFRELRDSHEPVRALYEQVQERSVMHQSVDPTESQ